MCHVQCAMCMCDVRMFFLVATYIGNNNGDLQFRNQKQDSPEITVAPLPRPSRLAISHNGPACSLTDPDLRMLPYRPACSQRTSMKLLWPVPLYVYFCLLERKDRRCVALPSIRARRSFMLMFSHPGKINPPHLQSAGRRDVKQDTHKKSDL